MILHRNKNFGDRFQVKTFFFFFFGEHPDFGTKIGIFSRLRPANSNNFEKWPTRVQKLDHPDLGDYQFLEAEFPEVFSVSNLRLPPKHDIVHYIETTGPPIKQRPRRLSPEKLAVLRKELSHLKELRIIRLSSSPWGSPVHMVKKSNGSCE